SYRGELFDDGSLYEGHVVAIGGHQFVGVCRRCLANELKKREVLSVPIDNKCSVENLMAAVLGVHLGKAEHLAVGKLTAEFTADGFQILYFFFAEGEPFGFVEGSDGVDLHNGLRRYADGVQLL